MLALKVGGLAAVVGFIAVLFLSRGRPFPGVAMAVVVLTGFVLLIAASVDALSRERSLSTGH